LENKKLNLSFKSSVELIKIRPKKDINKASRINRQIKDKAIKIRRKKQKPYIKNKINRTE
jgi:hypothetical protein